MKAGGYERVSLPVQYMEESLSELGYKVIEIMKRFYTQARKYRIMGDNYVPEYKGEDFVASDYSDIKYDVTVETGSTFKRSEASMRQDFNMALQSGLPLPPEAILEIFLDLYDIPNKEKYIEMGQQMIAEQKQQKQQELALQQQEVDQKGQASAAPPAGGGGGGGGDLQNILETSTDEGEILEALKSAAGGKKNDNKK